MDSRRHIVSIGVTRSQRVISSGSNANLVNIIVISGYRTVQFLNWTSRVLLKFEVSLMRLLKEVIVHLLTNPRT